MSVPSGLATVVALFATLVLFPGCKASSVSFSFLKKEERKPLHTVLSGSGKSRLCYHLIASCLEEDDKHVVLISSKTVPSSVVSGLPNKNSKLPSSKKAVVLNSLIVRQTSVYSD